MKRALAVAGIFLQAQVVWAQWAVIDASNLVQTTTTAINSVKTAANTAQQVINSYTQIRNQVAQIENQIRNLQRFDINYVQQILTLGQTVVGTLRHARGVSFELDQALAEFDALYPQVQQALGAAQVLTMRLQWVTQRRHAAAVAVHVQAVTHSLEQSYARLCELLSHAAAAKGNLDISQIQAQQNGVTHSILLQMQQTMVGNGRAVAQQQAEEATLQEAAMRELEAASRTEQPYTGASGRLATYRW